jgi:hypothetical protein
MIVVAFILFASLIFAWLAAPGGKPAAAPVKSTTGFVPAEAPARA